MEIIAKYIFHKLLFNYLEQTTYSKKPVKYPENSKNYLRCFELYFNYLLKLTS